MHSSRPAVGHPDDRQEVPPRVPLPRGAICWRDAKKFRAELQMPLILLGGITNRETMDLAMAPRASTSSRWGVRSSPNRT